MNTIQLVNNIHNIIDCVKKIVAYHIHSKLIDRQYNINISKSTKIHSDPYNHTDGKLKNPCIHDLYGRKP